MSNDPRFDNGGKSQFPGWGGVAVEVWWPVELTTIAASRCQPALPSIMLLRAGLDSG